MIDSETREIITAVGVLDLRQHYQTSKSGRLQPCLETDCGEAIFLHVDGENPFTELTLRDLLGSRVRVTGLMKRDTLVLSAEDIVVLDYDAEGLKQESEEISTGDATEVFPRPDDTQPIQQDPEPQTNDYQSVLDSETDRTS